MTDHGIIFNIQRFTIHDGPGIRTEIFLKGCPMKCLWCGNPESQKPYIQPGIYKSKCISAKKCGLCLEACPEEALIFYRGKLSATDTERCSRCMECARVCPADAVKQWGRSISADECIEEILRDREFYEKSRGGVTVSGGEPLLQSDFVKAIFTGCRREGIHTCCESTFHVKWEECEKILPFTDLFISDIKHMDSDVHRKYTGVGNERVLENLKRLVKSKKELILRIPVIPGVNDTEDNIKAAADFITEDLEGRVRSLQLLSFMRLGVEKYASLNMEYGMKDVKVNRKAFQKKVDDMAGYFSSRGIHCLVGTRERE